MRLNSLILVSLLLIGGCGEPRRLRAEEVGTVVSETHISAITTHIPPKEASGDTLCCSSKFSCKAQLDAYRDKCVKLEDRIKMMEFRFNHLGGVLDDLEHYFDRLAYQNSKLHTDLEGVVREILIREHIINEPLPPEED